MCISKKTRARNLGLIRWMMGGHARTVEKLSHIVNACYVSKMINEEKTISDEIARKIEVAFELPDQWLDRDNEELVKISNKGRNYIPKDRATGETTEIDATRARNLDMVRWMLGGQNHAAKKMASIINPTYLGRMATGHMVIPDDLAREMESVLDFPRFWFDRDNETLLKISHEDYELVSGLSNDQPRAVAN